MGGIEFAAESLKRHWIVDGHEVTWISTDIPAGARGSSADNVRVPAANFPEDLWQINSPLVFPWRIPAIDRLVAAHDAVSAHSLAPGLALLALRSAIRLRKPVVATQHVGVIPLRYGWLSALQEAFLCRAARWTTGRGAWLTFVGKAVRDWFVERAHVPESRVAMTPAGIDHDCYNFVTDADKRILRAKWQVAEGRFSVLFVGRFYEKKGLQLIRELARACPEAGFTLVGSGPLDPASWALPNVRVVRFVPTADLRELYGAHDLFIMPSVGEGWPAVVPQAMACGLPCMVSEETFAGYGRDPGMFIVCRRDPDAMCRALREAAAGREPLAGDRRGVSDYAMKTWDWKETARIYLRLFARPPDSAGPQEGGQ